MPSIGNTGDRDPLATAALVGTGAIGIFSRGIDTVRTVAAIPHASRTRQVGRLLFEGIVAGRPSRAVMPLSGGPFNFFGKAFAATNMLGAVLAPLGIAVAGTHLVSAYNSNGTEGILGTRPGRTGVMSGAGCILGVGLLSAAALASRGNGARAALKGAFQHPMLAAPLLTGFAMATMVATFANELGYLDFLNTDATRGVVDNARYTTDNLGDTLGRWVRPQ